MDLLFLRMLLTRHLLLLISIFTYSLTFSQEQGNRTVGMITGNILDEKQEPVGGASVHLTHLDDSTLNRSMVADRLGSFMFTRLSEGFYRLQISAIGFANLLLDSIHVRIERTEFVLNDLHMAHSESSMQEVVVYAEKPLLQSRDGNITFNAASSPLSAGSSASDLLKGLPLVAIDPDGKLSVRGKEPKVLIDDKPIELNAQQLQDFLESLPGSMIERIEVMTNPPPQYANEPGGVINIVTRKGRVGRTGRMQVYAGTRGENGINGSFNYRKKTLSLSLQGGYGYSLYEGDGYSRRKNVFADSINFLNVDNRYANRSRRPSLRMQLEGEINSRNLVNLVLQYNENRSFNNSEIRFAQLNASKDTFQYSIRQVLPRGNSQNPSAQFTYTLKGVQPGVQLRLFINASYSFSNTDRDFSQRYYDPADMRPKGMDSLQQQFSDNGSTGFSARYQYDRPFENKKTFFSSGAYYSYSSSRILLRSLGYDRTAGDYLFLPLLSNDFLFHQRILNLRFSMKQLLGEHTSVSGGFNAEQTDVQFDLYNLKMSTGNVYANLMPFFHFNHEWPDQVRVSFTYRRTIRRPGIGELNPSIDFTDPFNLRFGNIELKPTISNNLEAIVGKSRESYHWNLSMGYNVVQDAYAQIRALQPDGKTFVSWQNIDDRVEYQVSSWNGFTLMKKFRLNANMSYTYNRYSLRDRLQLRYRNGASFTSGLNTSWNPYERFNMQGGVTFNRFASPQGFVRWNTSMNIGIQGKFLEKRLILTVNMIDPIQQQINRTFTIGPNFTHESYSLSRTRNYRLTIAYQFQPSARKGNIDAESERRRILEMVPGRRS